MMRKNILIRLKEKKNVVKLSMVALVGAITVCGGAVLCSASAIVYAADTVMQSDAEEVNHEGKASKEVDLTSEETASKNPEGGSAMQRTNEEKLSRDLYQAVDSEDVDDIFKLLDDDVDFGKVLSYACDQRNDRVYDLIRFIRVIKIYAGYKSKSMLELKSVYVLYVAAYEKNENEVYELLEDKYSDDFGIMMELSQEVGDKRVIDFICLTRIRQFCYDLLGEYSVEEGKMSILSNYFMDYTDMKGLVEILRYDTSMVRILRLFIACDLSEIEQLSKALEDNTTLTELDLYCDRVRANGAFYISEALKKNTTLRKLDLYISEIGDDGAKHISDSLKVNSSLTELNLSDNRIGDEGAGSISEMLRVNSSLTVLSMHSNNIHAEGAGKISEALETNASLTSLSLGKNALRDEGLCEISEALKKNSVLTYLNIFDNNIGDSGKESLCEALKTNITLTGIE